MNNNQINEDAKTDLLNRIDSLDVLLGDIGERVQDAAGSLEALRGYVCALGAEEKQGLFVGSKPKKAFTVGDMAKEGDGESLPIGSRIENFINGYWEKTSEDEWTTRSGGVRSTDAIYFAGRKILRVGHEAPRRELELGDILFTKEDFEAVPKGHVVVEIVSPESFFFDDGERACSLHFNLFVDDLNDLDYFAHRINEGHFYYLYGGKPVPPADAELPLREAFDAWGANAVVEPVRFPDIAFTLSPDGTAHRAYGNGVSAPWLRDETVRLVAVLDDGKVIPDRVKKPKAVFEPGDVVRIYGGPFDGMKGHVLRVDLDLDNPYLVRAEGTTGFGRYEADDLALLSAGYVLNTTPGDRIRNSWTGEVCTVTWNRDLRYAGDYEFLMPKRSPKVGDVIDLKAARKLPIGSRVSVPGRDTVYWQKSLGRTWSCVSALDGASTHLGDNDVFQPGDNRRLLRYGHCGL